MNEWITNHFLVEDVLHCEQTCGITLLDMCGLTLFFTQSHSEWALKKPIGYVVSAIC